MDIKIKSIFFGWRIADKAEALEYAKFKIHRLRYDSGYHYKIPDEERIAVVNSYFEGIKFTSDDLK